MWRSLSLLWVILVPTNLPEVATPSSARSAEAIARVEPKLVRELEAARLRYGDPVFIRIFKQERLLEVWLADGERYRLFKTFPICAFSGALGPKERQGDRQAPEGFYEVTSGRLNPFSSYHLSMNLGYPNAYDRAHGRTGSHLMIHGNCVSIGCFAMTDAGIEQIYTLVDAALRRGTRAVPVHVFPFRMGTSKDAEIAASPWRDFWSELQAGYAAFEEDRQLPRIKVVDGRCEVERVGTVAAGTD